MDKQKEAIRQLAFALYGYSTATAEDCAFVAERLYEQGYRNQEWISTKARLPEKDGKYMVYDIGQHRGVSTAEIRITHFKKGDRYHEYMWRTHFSHWQPLPESPISPR